MDDSDIPDMATRSEKRVFNLVLLASLVLSAFFSVHSFAGELALATGLMTELNQVLKASDSLHKALMTQNEEQVEMGLRDLLVQLSRAKSSCQLAKPHERRHLIKILDAAHEQFELTQTSYGEERRARLEEGYNQLVNLVRIYRVDRAYGIFFCPKDKTTWIQKGLKAQNPFRAEARREPCGIRVPR